MTISTYAELQTAVGNWLHRTDLTSIIPDLITLGEKRIGREVRARAMEEALSVTISSGVATIPSDFIALKHAYVNSTPIGSLEVRPSEWLYKHFPTRSADSQPKIIAVEGSNFVFGPYPDSAYTIKGTYYKRLAALSSSAHAFFVANPDLYLFASLTEAAPYLGDDARASVWFSKYTEIRDAINKEAKEGEFSGALAMRR